MSLLKNMGGYIGYIIGAVFILPLLLLAYNHFLINKNDGQRFMNNYIESSIEMKIFVPDYHKEEPPHNKLNEIKRITRSVKSKNMGRDGSDRSEMQYRIFFDQKSKRYYQITMFDIQYVGQGVECPSWGFFYSISNKDVLITINKKDIDDPSYGTKEQPIQVLSVRGVDAPLPALDTIRCSLNYNTPIEQYKYNVQMYLTYVMSKEEFKKRFEKGK
ncbi:hypothetical protein AY601_2080 [Pedobacter cryoconitis]|uniref:DUF8188 domain-containing protein n=1 Tax=Pedobacter cryoconitis TaxID=188932 RepID=A0A127VCP1_9SPHI|nr:hypothetical protein [Pedobacter cryoconitis]AMP98981.1 hypothetical protein AY601_2080 [Pedobacter cryoconitis]